MESERKTRVAARQLGEEIETLPHLQAWIDMQADQVHRIEPGWAGVRGLVAIFEDDPKRLTRLKYNTLIERGHSWYMECPELPNPRSRSLADSVVPAGTSLQEVCTHWTRHVAGDGLRLFLVPGWNARMIWELFPKKIQDASKAKRRKHSRIESALQREVNQIDKEEVAMAAKRTQTYANQDQSANEERYTLTAAPDNADARPSADDEVTMCQVQAYSELPSMHTEGQSSYGEGYHNQNQSLEERQVRYESDRGEPRIHDMNEG